MEAYRTDPHDAPRQIVFRTRSAVQANRSDSARLFQSRKIGGGRRRSERYNQKAATRQNLPPFHTKKPRSKIDRLLSILIVLERRGARTDVRSVGSKRSPSRFQPSAHGRAQDQRNDGFGSNTPIVARSKCSCKHIIFINKGSFNHACAFRKKTRKKRCVESTIERIVRG
jgi:hypothetical protein